MHVSKSLLRSLIREMIVELASPQVPEKDLDDAPLGRYAFAPNREDDVPDEDNTDDEKELLKQVTGHLVHNMPMSSAASDEIRDFVDHGWYRPVFKPITSGKVYRGMTVTDDYLRKMCGINSERDGEKGHKVKSFTYQPRKDPTRWGHPGGASSSWTTDPEMTRQFTHTSDLEKEWQIVLVAKASDNVGTFIVGEDGFYRLRITKTMRHEKEAIALGPVHVSEIYWQRSEGYASVLGLDFNDEDN